MSIFKIVRKFTAKAAVPMIAAGVLAAFPSKAAAQMQGTNQANYAATTQSSVWFSPDVFGYQFNRFNSGAEPLNDNYLGILRSRLAGVRTVYQSGDAFFVQGINNPIARGYVAPYFGQLGIEIQPHPMDSAGLAVRPYASPLGMPGRYIGPGAMAGAMGYPYGGASFSAAWTPQQATQRAEKTNGSTEVDLENMVEDFLKDVEVDMNNDVPEGERLPLFERDGRDGSGRKYDFTVRKTPHSNPLRIDIFGKKGQKIGTYPEKRVDDKYLKDAVRDLTYGPYLVFFADDKRTRDDPGWILEEIASYLKFRLELGPHRHHFNEIVDLGEESGRRHYDEYLQEPGNGNSQNLKAPRRKDFNQRRR